MSDKTEKTTNNEEVKSKPLAINIAEWPKKLKEYFTNYMKEYSKVVNKVIDRHINSNTAKTVTIVDTDYTVRTVVVKQIVQSKDDVTNISDEDKKNGFFIIVIDENNEKHIFKSEPNNDYFTEVKEFNLKDYNLV